MRTKVSEATGPVLDWMVLLAQYGAAVTLDEDLWIVREGIADMPLNAYTPSTDWAQGGPIIEQSRIQVAPRGVGTAVWEALLQDNIFEPDGTECFQDGPTPLIAAMRCYVTAKLGDEVEVPEELT